MAEVEELSVADLAWTAGIIDGEGSIGVFKVQTGHQLRLDVGSTSLKMARRLEAIWGGCLYMPYDNSNWAQSHWKPRYQWRANGRLAIKVLTAIMPYLVTKKEQALEAVEYEVLSKQGRENLRLRLKDLKKEVEV